MAPYSFTIACALRTKAQIICACLNENIGVFGYFFTSACAQKAKLTVNFLAFPSVKFGSKCFTLLGAHFSGKSVGPVFLQW